MIIVCDVDNVLNDLTQKTISLYNHQNGKNIKISDITTYNLFECLPKENAEQICALFKEKALWDSLEPIDGSQSALKAIVNSGIDVYLATATDPANFKWKCDWINKYYEFISTDNIIRIKNKSLLKADVMIDDCWDNLINSEAEKICLDYPWNRNENVSNIHRVFSWSEVLNIIKNLERMLENE